MAVADQEYEEWFQNLFDQYSETLARYVRSCCGRTLNHREEDECVQEAFMTLWEKRHRLYQHPKVVAWLYRAANNNHKHHLARAITRSKHTGINLDDLEHAVPVAGNENTEASVLLREQRETIISVVGAENYRFLLDYYDVNISNDALASHLGITPSTLRSRVRRIIAPLKNGNLIIFLVLLRNIL